MNEILSEELNRYAKHIADSFDASCGIFDLAGDQLSYPKQPPFCERCRSCEYEKTHLYGCYEAERWDNKYIYYCPMGMIFLSNLLRSHGETKAGLITGPILMGEQEDLELATPPELGEQVALLPNWSTSKVRSVSEMIYAITSLLAVSDEDELGDSDKLSLELNNCLYEISESQKDTPKSHYPIEEEKMLLGAISSSDKDRAQELLNRLLGHIYFNSAGDFNIIKARVNELLVLLSRASIDGGADIEQIFWTNNSVLDELKEIKELNQLNRWLSMVMHRYISYVFDFTDIKHVDVIHKATEYIKQNYTAKLTLDEVANHVYLSKSYLSKIFKEELHCNFAGYVNNLRVEKSKLLLMDQSISLIDLASMVGFEDQSYFTKVFKKHVGISPGKYRENRGNVNYKKEQMNHGRNLERC